MGMDLMGLFYEAGIGLRGYGTSRLRDFGTAKPKDVRAENTADSGQWAIARDQKLMISSLAAYPRSPVVPQSRSPRANAS